MKIVKIKCSSCREEVSAIQYPGARKIKGFCDNCEKEATMILRKGCGIPMLMEKEDS